MHITEFIDLTRAPTFYTISLPQFYRYNQYVNFSGNFIFLTRIIWMDFKIVFISIVHIVLIIAITESLPSGVQILSKLFFESCSTHIGIGSKRTRNLTSEIIILASVGWMNSINTDAKHSHAICNLSNRYQILNQNEDIIVHGAYFIFGIS